MAVSLTERAAKEVKKILEEKKIRTGHVAARRRGRRRLQRIPVQPGLRPEVRRKNRFQIRLPRRERRGRQEKRLVPRRHDGRFLRRPGKARLHLRKPQRHEKLRLRQFVPGVIEVFIAMTQAAGRFPAAFRFDADTVESATKEANRGHERKNPHYWHRRRWTGRHHRPGPAADRRSRLAARRRKHAQGNAEIDRQRTCWQSAAIWTKPSRKFPNPATEESL